MEVEREKVQTLSQDIPQWVKGAFLKGSEKEQDQTRADEITREDIQKQKTKGQDFER